MRHTRSGIIATASDSRSQADNRRKAAARLRTNIALDARAELSDEFEPSPQMLEVIKRGPLGKNSKTRGKVDYLLVLAEILDLLHADKGALSKTAARIGVTTAGLGKLLRGDERLARRVAELRSQHGLKPLR